MSNLIGDPSASGFSDYNLISGMREAMDSSSDGSTSSFLEQIVNSLESTLKTENTVCAGHEDKGVISTCETLLKDIKAAQQQSSGTLTVSGNTINTGSYLISGSASHDGSLTITDEKTNKTVQIWGDPHVSVDGKEVAEFQTKSMNLSLSDGTVLHIDPTSLSNGVSHLASVTVSKGKQSVSMTGNSGTFQKGVTTGSVKTAAVSKDQVSDWSSGFSLDMGTDDKLYSTNSDGSKKSQITGNGGTDLDGLGGGFVY